MDTRVVPTPSDLISDLVTVPVASAQQEGEKDQIQSEREAIDEAISNATLQAHQKRVLQMRVRGLLRQYGLRKTLYSITFHTLRTTTTVGSLIVPALLSVQYVNGNVSSQNATIGIQVYWAVWVLSLFVTICSGLINLMKIDKKYYMLHTCYEHIVSEVWQYVQLSGKYSGLYTQGQEATHTNQYIYICNVLEKIRMKHIEEEYFKVTDQNPTAQGDSLVPPTPLKNRVEENSVLGVNDSEGARTTLRKFT